jgi:hypothetical protein
MARPPGAGWLLSSGLRYLMVDLPVDKVLQVADAARDMGALVFNAGAPDERLREELAPYFAAATRSGLSLVWKIVLVVVNCSAGRTASDLRSTWPFNCSTSPSSSPTPCRSPRRC